MNKGIRASLLGFFISCLFVFIFVHAETDRPLFEQPLLITSAGQSAEVQLASVLAKRAGLDYSLSKAATHNDLQNVKSLVIVLGVSLKGLGAAGLDMEKETERVRDLVSEAKKRNIPFLCLHLGGDTRRGQQTDDIISAFLPSAKMAIIVKSGNADGIFTRICRENDISLVEVEKTTDALEPLKNAFN